MALTQFTTLTFDVIGTLIDFETGVLEWMRPRLAAVKPGITDEEILEAHAAAELKLHDQTAELHGNLNQTQMLHRIWAEIAQQTGAQVEEGDNASLDESWGEWPAFPDSVEALAYLRQHFRLVAVTNAGRASALKMAKTLGEPFHLILTAEDIGATKPDARVFKHVLATLERDYCTKQADILHVAQSQFHDIKPAKALGFHTAWIERRHGQKGSGGTPDEKEKVMPDFHAASLGGLAEQHKQAAAHAAGAGGGDTA